VALQVYLRAVRGWSWGQVANLLIRRGLLDLPARIEELLQKDPTLTPEQAERKVREHFRLLVQQTTHQAAKLLKIPLP
ncbi:MAG: hypothetical protein ABDI19_04535, partial [Armatimonadota bacterium]